MQEILFCNEILFRLYFFRSCILCLLHITSLLTHTVYSATCTTSCRSMPNTSLRCQCLYRHIIAAFIPTSHFVNSFVFYFQYMTGSVVHSVCWYIFVFIYSLSLLFTPSGPMPNCTSNAMTIKSDCLILWWVCCTLQWKTFICSSSQQNSNYVALEKLIFMVERWGWGGSGVSQPEGRCCSLMQQQILVWCFQSECFSLRLCQSWRELGTVTQPSISLSRGPLCAFFFFSGNTKLLLSIQNAKIIIQLIRPILVSR